MAENVILNYGAWGVGKTSLSGTLAKHIFKTTGKKTRVATADPGGFKPLKPLLTAGLVEVMQVNNWSYPFLVMDQVTKGYWPKNPEIPNSPLLPGVQETKTCTFCGEDSGARGHTMVASCKKCGKAYPPGTVLPSEIKKINGFEEAGALVCEGLTSWGDYLMDYMANELAKGRNIGQIRADDVTTKFQDGTDEDGKPYMIGGSTWSHYNIVQDRLQQLVRNCHLTPVDVVLWTALETAPVPGEAGEGLIHAPMLPGKKAASKCGSWFTDVGHLDLEPDGKTRKLYYTTHKASNDPTPYKAKNSAPPEGRFPDSIVPDMGVFFEELSKAYTRVAESLKTLR